MVQGCINEERPYENGKIEMNIQIDQNMLGENSNISIECTIINIGNSTVTVIDLEYFFLDEITRIRNSSNEIIFPNIVRSVSYHYNHHLVDIKPGDSISRTYILHYDDYPFMKNSIYYLKGNYFLGNINTITESHWVGEVFSNEIIFST